MARIEGRKHDDLLFEKGGRAFPYIVFMDDEGSVLAVQPGAQRTVGGFQKVFKDKVQRYVDLRAKAQAGDESAQIDFAMLRCDLGQIDFAELRTALDGKTLSDAQKLTLKTVEANATLNEAKKILDTGRGDPAAFEAAGERLTSALAQNLVPDSPERRQEFYGILFNYGLRTEDPDLAEKALAGVREALTEMLGDITRYEASLQKAADQIAELRAKEQEGCGEEEEEGCGDEGGIEEGCG